MRVFNNKAASFLAALLFLLSAGAFAQARPSPSPKPRPPGPKPSPPTELMRTARTALLRFIAAALFLLAAPRLHAEDIYLAQSAAGSSNGSSCANARAASYFNSVGNWGASAGKIDAGDVVHLCGAVSTNLTFQGSGTSGNYITVDGTAATYSAYFTVNEKSWWRVQNVTWASGWDNSLIEIYGGSNGVFSGNFADNMMSGAVWIAQGNNTLPSDITIANNYIRTTTADLGNVQVDLIFTEGSTNVTIEGNYLEHRVGGAGGGVQHDDIIQTWESGSTGSHGPPSSWTIRHNWIVMNSPSASDRSFTMIENLGGTNRIYGNVFLGLSGGGSANGLSLDDGGNGGTFYVYNNTLVAKNGSVNNTVGLGSGTFFLRNNIIYTASGQTAFRDTSTSNSITRDHNLWYGSSIPSCGGVTGEICNQDPGFVAYSANNFALASGSPAIGAGVDLGSTYNVGLSSSATWPGPTIALRQAPWEIGAYVYGNALLPAPTNLRATPI